MYTQISRIGVCQINQKGYKSKYAGSSKYKVGNDHICLKTHGINPNQEEKTAEEIKRVITPKKKTQKYKLKKTKIRNKILNFFSLNASKKFCAFYTITFPVQISDELAYICLNTWLTRLRKTCGLKSYLWVAERQKNNTIHFHLITNNFIQIRTANDFMKTTLLNCFAKGSLNCNIKILEKYNGIDVDNIHQSKRAKNKKERLPRADAQRKLSCYLTKYITKNNVLSDRLPWHCSRDISALFISMNYDDAIENDICQLIADNPEAVTVYEKEYFTMAYYNFIPDEYYFKDLTEINNFLWEYLHDPINKN